MIVDKHGRQVEEGYLGTVDGDNEHTLASDGANHYSIKGYLDFARRMRENQQPGEAFGRPSASAERKGPDDDSPFR